MDYCDLWIKFESSGSIADYIAYRTSIDSANEKGEQGNADNY